MALLSKVGMMEEWGKEDVPTISYRAWSTVGTRQLEITACLNLYHELRGSEYRHGVDDTCQYHYEKLLASLRKETAM